MAAILLHLLPASLYALLGVHFWHTRWIAPTSAPRQGLQPKERVLLLVALVAHGFALNSTFFSAEGIHFGFSLALSLTAIVYFSGDADGFQKTDGRHAFASRILFAPYRCAARVNAWLWTRRHPHSDHIAEGVWLGRHPDASASTCAVPGLSTLLDLCPELSAPRAARTCHSLPWLDLVVPTPAQLDEAAQAIESARHAGPLLVCCALGYSRSACAVVAWLYRTRRSASIAAAIEHVRACRPHIVLSDAHMRALASLEAGS